MNRVTLNRRRFLQAVGASALTYPFLSALPSYAQAQSAPQYLILVFTPCGFVQDGWSALGPARGSTVISSPLTGSTGAGAFRQTLQPLATGPTLSHLVSGGHPANDLTSQTIVLDGLNVGTANGSHEAGMAALWTGVLNGGSSVAGRGASIDQAILQQLKSGRPFDSIALMVRDKNDFNGREVKTRMIYNATDFVDPYDDPVTARNTIFPNVASTDAGVSRPDKKTAIRRVVFGRLNQELTALQSRLCTEDRVQLQSLQQAWNQLDQQLAAAAGNAKNCHAPDAVGGAIDFPTAAKLQMDILALALACGQTQIASLQFSTATSNVTHAWIDPRDTQTHHQHSHSGPSSFYSLGTDVYNPATYQPGTPKPDAQLAPIDLWYGNQVAYLAQSLNSYNLLGQAVICWGSEIQLGQPHNHDASPFVLIGGGGGKLKTGQLVQFPLNLPGNNPPTGNRFHNDLLITLAHVMGVPMDKFGTVSGVPPNANGMTFTFGTGPITQILKS